MSNSSTTAQSGIDPRLGLKFIAAGQLMPLFEGGPVDVDLARLMAHSAIDAYAPQTRADCLNAARTIAFSMAALSLLSRINREYLPLPEELNAFKQATALNSSADKSERTMMLRHRTQKARPEISQPLENPEPEATEAEEAEIEAIVAEALKHQNAVAPAPAETLTQPPAASVEAAIRASFPGFAAALQKPALQKPASPKQDLLRNSALQRGTGQSQASRPA